MYALLLRAWPWSLPGSARLRFTLLLALVLVLTATLGRPRHEGDVLEYTTMATAIAAHGTPDIRADDVERARPIAPLLGPLYDQLRDGMRDEQRQLPLPGFARTAENEVYAIHFFSYSALAAVALTVFGALGLPVTHAFVAVNLAAVTVLGAALHRLLGTAWRASAGVALFFACGGILYWNWSSPEIASAASLLAALALFCTGAPVIAGLLAGLAASHNPPIVFFAAFAPAFLALLHHRAGASPRSAVLALNTPRNYAGVMLCVALALAPFAYNLYQFGIPSWITRMSTNQALIGWPRLVSFFLDPNQGMIVAVPVVAVAMVACGWRGVPAQRRGHALLIACAAFFTLALAVPALAAVNWNSGARGVMRYGFWASMPLLFAFLLYLRAQPVFPRALVALVLLLQALFMAHAKSYRAIEFSPAAHWMLRHAPGWYNPDPEIFYERLTNGETFLDPALAYSYAVDGKVLKTLYNPAGGGVLHLCGPGRQLANASVDAGHGGWRYFDGAPACAPTAPVAGKETTRKEEGKHV